MTASRSKRFLKIVLIAVSILAVASVVVYFAVEPIEKIIYPMKYQEDVQALSDEFDFSPSFIYAIIFTESKFEPSVLSSAGAKGLMQITDDTYRWACRRTGTQAEDPDVLYDPATNLRYGVTILSLLREQFSDTSTMLAAYNAGQGHVREWLSDPAYSSDGKTLFNIPYEETENYVHRVINIQKKYQALYNIP